MTTTARTAYNDQVDAAVRDAARCVTAAAHLPGAHIANPYGPWTLRQLATLALDITAGHTLACPHIATNRAQLMHACAWRPRHIACTTCAPELAPTPTEEHTCDRCHTPNTHLNHAVINLGPILYNFALCTPCLTTEGNETR